MFSNLENRHYSCHETGRKKASRPGELKGSLEKGSSQEKGDQTPAENWCDCTESSPYSNSKEASTKEGHIAKGERRLLEQCQ